MDLDLARIRENAHKDSTETLLDRVTVYRAEMEAAAVEIMELELRSRGIDERQIRAHLAIREENPLLRHPDGTVIRCNFCERPAIEYRQQWHRLWGWFLPLLPRTFHICKEHLEEPPVDPYGRPLHYHREQEGGP